MTIDRPRNRWMRRWSAKIFVLLFVVLGSPVFAAEPCSGTAPLPTGPFPVSSWSRDFVDSAREEALAEGEVRRYTVTFYYPASGAAAGLQTRALYAAVSTPGWRKGFRSTEVIGSLPFPW